MNKWGVAVENVSVNWGSNHNILEKINFSLAVENLSSAMLPLMGPSGQGKSTLLYLLASLKIPSEGRIMWTFPDGTRYQLTATTITGDVTTLRRHYFGFSFQNSTLSPYLTVIENIAYPLKLNGVAWQKAILMAEERLEEVLLPFEKANQSRLIHSYPSQLSGGQKQRIALAQAIVHNPYVLFADEPTGQLDLHTRQQVMHRLKEWVAKGEGKRCLIWVTHHHIHDLDFMGLTKLLFIEERKCIPRDRAWLAKWL
jgi:putative ABC transport system ATP-binding protein